MYSESSRQRHRVRALAAAAIAIVMAKSIPSFHWRGLTLWVAYALMVFAVCLGAWHAYRSQR